MEQRSDIQIVPFAGRHAAAFSALNLEWIERLFVVERPDREQLGDPQRHIIDRGGHVLIAERAGAAVGTCALLHEDDETYELAKMTVAPEARGLGIGRRLLDAAITQARRDGMRRITLISHSGLRPALNLYRSAGFQEMNFDAAATGYQRCDIAMCLDLDRE